MDGAASRDQLLQGQGRVFAAGNEVIAILGGQAPPSADVLATARWSFASILMQHLALKERYVYARLEADPRPQVQSFYGALKADLLQCFDGYSAHMESWPTAKALQEWSTYRPKAISVVEAFLQYLKREEERLFDFIDRLGIDISLPHPVTSNWVRNCFAIKDKIEDR